MSGLPPRYVGPVTTVRHVLVSAHGLQATSPNSQIQRYDSCRLSDVSKSEAACFDDTTLVSPASASCCRIVGLKHCACNASLALLKHFQKLLRGGDVAANGRQWLDQTMQSRLQGH